MKKLYPLVEPFTSEYVPVGSGHELYLEQSGNPHGQPVILMHGGPGGWANHKYRQYFNSQKYRIIAYEQRGCNRSRFVDPLKDNTTRDLVNDIEKIRKHLKIEKWHVYGGSWGSTLALAYAECYPTKVLTMHLRGIYYGSKAEDLWLFIEGANRFFPDKYEPLYKFLQVIPRQERLDYLYAQVMASDHNQAWRVAKMLNDWESTIMKLIPEEPEPVSPDKELEMIISKRVMMHYLKNECFLKNDQLLKNIKVIKRIPGVIIHGRYDLVCPIINAWKLHKVWPEAAFEIVPDAGHSHSDPGNQQKIMEYTDKFLKLTYSHKV